MTHATIIKRLERVKADYRRALKDQSRMSEEQEEAFMNGMEATFNLFKEDWEGEIERDGLLSAGACHALHGVPGVWCAWYLVSGVPDIWCLVCLVSGV